MSLEGEEGKTKLRGRIAWTIAIDNMPLFIARYSRPIIYSIFLYLLFYKEILYFISYQMNKSDIEVFTLQPLLDLLILIVFVCFLS